MCYYIPTCDVIKYIFTHKLIYNIVIQKNQFIDMSGEASDNVMILPDNSISNNFQIIYSGNELDTKISEKKIFSPKIAMFLFG